MKELLSRVRRKQALAKEEAELLKPREVEINSGLTVPSVAGHCLAVFGAQLIGLSLFNSLDPRRWIPGLLLLAVGVTITLSHSKRRQHAHWLAEGKDLSNVAPELAAVADIFQPTFLLHNVAVVHQAGPDAPLLPEVKKNRLVITKRFWTELSTDEQRCAIHYVNQSSYFYIRPMRRVVFQWFAALVTTFWLVVFVLKPSLNMVIALVILLAFCWLIAGWLSSFLALRFWKRAALEARTPEAPLFLLRRLVEEVSNPAERRHLERTLKAYEKALPEIQWEVEQFQRNTEIAARQAHEREERALLARGGHDVAVNSAPEDDHNEVKNR